MNMKTITILFIIMTMTNSTVFATECPLGKIEVVNKHHCKHIDNATYIGRGSVLGNPFIIGKDGDREQVIAKYYQWIREQWLLDGDVKRELLRLVDVIKRGNDLKLACFCKPKPCHGDILKYAIMQLVEKGF